MSTAETMTSRQRVLTALDHEIPDLLDNGIDILNPVQVSAKDMDPSALKSRFGDRLAFWGGAIDAQHVLHSSRL